MGNIACLAADKANCPEPHGPDFDLGASANLIALEDGRRLLTIGQKSGLVFALDPDGQGRIVWQARIERGGPLGGVQWGTATDGKAVYAATSDVALKDLVIGQPFALDADAGGGLQALDAATGNRLWTTQRRAPAPAARPSAIRRFHRDAGLRVVRSVDGHLRAYPAADGRVLWDYDRGRPFDTVNG